MLKLLNKDLYSPKEIAEYLNVNIRTIYYWIREEEIESIKISKRLIRIRKEALEKIINNNKQ